jgi:hypothetical protein
MALRIGNFNVRVDGDPPRGPAGYQKEYHPVPVARQALLRQAIDFVNQAYRSQRSECDSVFLRIGGGKTLGQLLQRRDLWISYSPYTDFVGYAEAPDIILSEAAYKYGAEKLGSVLVHELSHVGGVGGGFQTGDRTDHSFADHAAKACTGTVHPVTHIIRSLDTMLEQCSNCRPQPRRLGR